MMIASNCKKFAFVYALTAIFPSQGYALDQCRDILKDGVYLHFSDKSNYYFKMIRDFTFAQKTFEESKHDRSFGGNVPIGDLVIGGNYNEDQFNQKKSEIRNRLSTNITSSKILDMSLTSGDPGIIGAWTQCMQKRGGLALTYEVDDSYSVRAKLQWFAPENSGQGSVVLSDDVSLPSLVDVSHSSVSCFKKGRVLTAGTACTAVLRLKDAQSPMTLLAQAEYKGDPVGDAPAYLPPRLKPVEQVKPFNFEASADDPSTGGECAAFKSNNVWVIKNVTARHVSCSIGKLVDDGWLFDVSSLAISLAEISNPGRGSHCELRKDTPTPYMLGYTNAAYSAVAGTQSCTTTANVNIKREVWVPY